jgi:hypothetical protein
MGDQSNYGNPGLRVHRIGGTETRKHSKGRWQSAECFLRSRKVTGGHHYPIPNQCATDEATQLQGRPGTVDAPDHDRPDIGIPVGEIKGRLGLRAA